MYLKVYKYYVPSLVHSSIDIVYPLWYNMLVKSWEPISTPPDVTQRTDKHIGAATARKDGTNKNLKGDTHHV